VKRTPLKRRTPLRPRKPWRVRRPKRISVVVVDVWREGLHLCRCIVCGTSVNLDGHHAIPKRVLIRLGYGDYVNDVRNRVPTCRHDHESHETRARPIRRVELPQAVFEFADELGLGWYIDRFYPHKEAA
jgi:hypothetical protein